MIADVATPTCRRYVPSRCASRLVYSIILYIICVGVVALGAMLWGISFGAFVVRSVALALVQLLSQVIARFRITACKRVYSIFKVYCMKHTLLSVLLLIIASAGTASAQAQFDTPEAPALAQADMLFSNGVDEFNEPTIEVRGKVLRITNAEGALLELYDLTGRQVIRMQVDSPDKTVSLNLRKGCYIVRVGKLTRKIALN